MYRVLVKLFRNYAFDKYSYDQSKSLLVKEPMFFPP